MDRDATADWIWTTYGTLLTAYGFTNTDDSAGYGPVLDNAFLAYLVNHSYDTTELDYDIPSADQYCFQAVTTALTYDLVLPKIGMTADFSVDAPLTSVKNSQVYRQMKELRDDARRIASQCGYFGAESNVGGIRVNLDFKEPGISTGQEF